MKTKFNSYKEEIKSSTVIILEIDELKYYKISEYFPGKVRDLYNIFRDKVKELNIKFKDYFYLPIDVVGFSTEVAIKGENFALAKIIASELYHTIINFKPELSIKIGIGYGDITFLSNRLHYSNGPVLIKVGRAVDNRKNDGIEIVD